jgi:DNA-binding transcriptional LysR family regulator
MSDSTASLDLRKIRHAIALDREGNFARASAHLCLTQSALTRSIQALEKEVGLRLFDRSHARIVATPAGRIILDRAQALIGQADDLRRDIDLIRDAKLGNLTFGSSPIPGAVFLPMALARICRDNPHLEIRVETKSSLELLGMLLEEKVEFFLGDARQFSDRADISVRPLEKVPVHFFVRSGHPLAQFVSVQPHQVNRFPLGSSRFLAHRTEVLARIYGAKTALLSGHFICDDIQTLKTVTLNSDLILLTADRLVPDLLESGQLVQLSIPQVSRVLTTHISVVRRVGRTLSPTARLLLDHVRQIVGEEAHRE